MAVGELIRAAILIVAGIELWMIIDLLITVRKQKKKLAEKDQDIHKLEFTLDEKQDVMDSLNNEVSRLNRKLRKEGIITTLEQLNNERNENKADNV